MFVRDMHAHLLPGRPPLVTQNTRIGGSMVAAGEGVTGWALKVLGAVVVAGAATLVAAQGVKMAGKAMQGSHAASRRPTGHREVMMTRRRARRSGVLASSSDVQCHVRCLSVTER
jgi:hypothetical protein